MPTPFAAADVVVYDDSGRLAFHYAIVEVLSTAIGQERLALLQRQS